jgi:hypothetical protein
MTPEENIKEIKHRILELVKTNELKDFAKENGTLILDVLFDNITDSSSTVLHEAFHILSNLAWADVIQGRFIAPSIDLYMSCDNKRLRREIIYFLINIYYDDNFINELMDNNFAKCLPMYICDWDEYLREKRGILYEKCEANILCEMIKLYIQYEPEYNVDTKLIYHALFSSCTNLSFNDINDKTIIACAKEMYFKYNDAPELHNEIIFFLSNVYLDKNANVLIPDFDKFANDFICKYYTLYDDMVMDILEMYKMTDFIPSVLDVSLNLLNDNLSNTKHFKRILKFYKTISEIKECSDYICTSTTAKRMVQYSMQTGMYTYILSQLFSYFTSHKDTEVPCEFFYNQFIVPFEHKRVYIYPNYMFFSLSNILAVKENYSFVDMVIITNFISTYLYRYNDDARLYTDFYHIIANLYDAQYLVYCLRDMKFMDAFNSWMCKIQYTDDIGTKHDAYDIIKLVCKTISQHDDLYYMFDCPFGDIVLDISRNAYNLRDIESYMNCTLQQKCALILYKKKMIKLEELQALDIQLHLVA